MRITLSIGLAIAFLAAVFTVTAAGDIRHYTAPDNARSPALTQTAVLSDTPTYTAFLPVLLRPHPCRISPCLLWTENFEDATSSWLTHTYDISETFPPGPHRLEYVNGAYQMDLTPPQFFRSLASTSPLTHSENTIVEVSARWTQYRWGTGYGLIFGADAPISPTRFYAAMVFCLGVNDCNWQHVAIWRYDDFRQDHDYVRIADNLVCTPSPCVNKHDQWNRIRVVRDGSSIVMQINDTTVFEIEDTSYIGPGYAGAFVEIFENPKEVYAEFDNMAVYDLGPSGN